MKNRRRSCTIGNVIIVDYRDYVGNLPYLVPATVLTVIKI